MSFKFLHQTHLLRDLLIILLRVMLQPVLRWWIWHCMFGTPRMTCIILIRPLFREWIMKLTGQLTIWLLMIIIGIVWVMIQMDPIGQMIIGRWVFCLRPYQIVCSCRRCKVVWHWITLLRIILIVRRLRVGMPELDLLLLEHLQELLTGRITMLAIWLFLGLEHRHSDYFRLLALLEELWIWI